MGEFIRIHWKKASVFLGISDLHVAFFFMSEDTMICSALVHSTAGRTGSFTPVIILCVTELVYLFEAWQIFTQGKQSPMERGSIPYMPKGPFI